MPSENSLPTRHFTFDARYTNLSSYLLFAFLAMGMESMGFSILGAYAQIIAPNAHHRHQLFTRTRTSSTYPTSLTSRVPSSPVRDQTLSFFMPLWRNSFCIVSCLPPTHELSLLPRSWGSVVASQAFRPTSLVNLFVLLPLGWRGVGVRVGWGYLPPSIGAQPCMGGSTGVL